MTATRKAIMTVVMFAIAAALVFVASATNSTGPLFAMFVPLLLVPWALTRPEPGVLMPPPIGPPSEEEEPDVDREQG